MVKKYISLLFLSLVKSNDRRITFSLEKVMTKKLLFCKKKWIQTYPIVKYIFLSNFIYKGVTVKLHYARRKKGWKKKQIILEYPERELRFKTKSWQFMFKSKS